MKRAGTRRNDETRGRETALPLSALLIYRRAVKAARPWPLQARP
ncbi:hypothetical protein [Serratia sp. 14-2641]|nr:hypothetical protein [Serratia sp. 14-2641]